MRQYSDACTNYPYFACSSMRIFIFEVIVLIGDRFSQIWLIPWKLVRELLKRFLIIIPASV